MEYLFKFKNKQFIFECLELLKSNNAFDEKIIEILTSEKECHNSYKCNLPILIEVNVEGVVSRDLYFDRTNKRRYYPNKFIVGDHAFIVCNDWYYNNKVNKRDNRTPFVQWVASKI